MSEEIKEILDELKNDDYIRPYEDVYSEYPIKTIDKKQTHLLLNYITNLQKENEKLKQINEELKQSKLLNIEFQDMEQELDQYKNNWEELKKWLKYEFYEMSNDINCEDILNKMKELEEDK